MIIARITKFLLKLWFGLALIGFIIVYLIINIVKDLGYNPPEPIDTITEMQTRYENCRKGEDGTVHWCPVCHKTFVKDGSNFCSHECEEQYWHIMETWEELHNIN